MLLGRGKMPFLNSLAILKINTQFLINLDFYTSFKGIILPASYSSWKGKHSKEHMVKIPFFLIENRVRKEADHIQYLLEQILLIKLLLLMESSCH